MENELNNSEYGEKRCGVLREQDTAKCAKAVIPVLAVEHIADLRGLSACFVHVIDTNSTYYIDDKYRLVLTWAGTVEADDYNFATNPRRLRNQWVVDFANNKAAFYNSAGEYRLITMEVENGL